VIRYAAERLAAGAGVLLAVSFLTFWLGTLIPGDLVTVLVGSEGATSQQYRDLRHTLGLDAPLVVQYGRWLRGAVRGDLGTSPITGRSVTDEIGRHFPISLELAVLSLVESILIGVPTGVFAAVRANRPAGLVVRSALFVAFSIPPFVAGVLLVLAGALYLGPLYQVAYVPMAESVSLNLRSMILPTLSIAIPLSAMTAQMSRAALLEALGEAYIVTAVAKGAPRRNVVYIHALKNALVPVITLQGYVFGSLIGGLIVTEQIFNLEGLGRGLLVAIGRRDYPFVVAGTLVIAAMFVLANLVVDILYPILDPTQRT
jgi:peptide/nickel transport system permease protein